MRVLAVCVAVVLLAAVARAGSGVGTISPKASDTITTGTHLENGMLGKGTLGKGTLPEPLPSPEQQTPTDDGLDSRTEEFPSSEEDLQDLLDAHHLMHAEAHAFGVTEPTIVTDLSKLVESEATPSLSTPTESRFEETTVSQMNPVADAAGLWTNPIRYFFWSWATASVPFGGSNYGIPTATQQGNFRTATTELAGKTCITFKELTTTEFLAIVNGATDEKVVIVVGHPQANAAFANAVGYRAAVVYGKAKAALVALGSGVGVGSIRHEVGHLIGLGHTHQRKDAADHLIHRLQFMDNVWQNQYEIGKMGNHDDSVVAFEFASLMSYPAWSLAMASADLQAHNNQEARDKHRRKITVGGHEMYEYRLLDLKAKERPDWGTLKTQKYWKDRAKKVSMDYRKGGLGQVIADAAKWQKWTIADIEGINHLYACPDKRFAKHKETEITAKKCATDFACPSKADLEKSVEMSGHCMDSFPGLSAMPPVPTTNKKGRELSKQELKQRTKQHLAKYRKNKKTLGEYEAVCKWVCFLKPEFKTAKCAIPAYGEASFHT